MSRRVTLRLRFPELAQDLRPASIRVVVEQASEADAAAQELSRHEFADVAVPRSTSTATLDVDVPDDVAAAGEACLRVHVDVDGSRALAPGDYVNPARVPLPPSDADACEVQLTGVG